MTAFIDLEILSPKIRKHPDTDRYILFWCPGCRAAHQIQVSGPNSWVWNGDPHNTTLQPSVLVSGEGGVCHSFVTNGHIHFLGDSTHGMAGRTTNLGDWPPHLTPTD